MIAEAILYRDDDLLVINKPAGTPVHGSRILQDRPQTLLSLARSYTGKLVHAVHRLDRPVSGALLLALNPEILAALGQSFENRRVHKHYLAVVRGWTENEGTISHALLPPRDERKANSIPRKAVTGFERIATVELPEPVQPYASSRYSLVGLHPQTGRRHQLRRHMKHISHHLVGDTTYGRGEHNRLFREKLGCRRLLLHAWQLGFQHPQSGEWLSLQAPLDAEFSSIISEFGWWPAVEAWAADDRVQL
jgi:tRNA pseudouridine65 synthase